MRPSSRPSAILPACAARVSQREIHGNGCAALLKRHHKRVSLETRFRVAYAIKTGNCGWPTQVQSLPVEVRPSLFVRRKLSLPLQLLMLYSRLTSSCGSLGELLKLSEPV